MEDKAKSKRNKISINKSANASKGLTGQDLLLHNLKRQGSDIKLFILKNIDGERQQVVGKLIDYDKFSIVLSIEGTTIVCFYKHAIESFTKA